MLLLSSADFFKINFFIKFFKGPDVIRVSDSLDPNQDRQNMLILIWVQTNCTAYQKTTIVATSKERVKILDHWNFA